MSNSNWIRQNFCYLVISIAFSLSNAQAQIPWFQTKEYSLKGKVEAIYEVDWTNQPSDEILSVYQNFDNQGRLHRHNYILNGFSQNMDSLIYHPDGKIDKIITTVYGYDFIQEYRYEYGKDGLVKVSIYNNSTETGNDGKELVLAGILHYFYENSLLIKIEYFDFESDYEAKKPSGEINFSYDNKQQLKEARETRKDYEQRTLCTFNDENLLTERKTTENGKVKELITFSDYQVDEQGNWILRRVKSTSNPEKSYSIRRTIAYYE